ncbi:MAG: AMIN domain-containing protein [Desulfobacteraceae bacterium]|nr:AMIN domain-containing protein [Desulfobacteraceae bacterium]MDH3882350.1 AMIN domain-containing protein [Desulfobacteraceae bacterium]
MIHIFCMVQFCLAGIASAGPIDDVRANVYAWHRSWQNRDINSYMSFYSPDFRSEDLDYKDWKQKKIQAFKTSGDIQVEITDLGVFIEAEYATARFVQRYHDSKFSDVGEKTLTMVNSNGKWKIVSEAWKPLVMSARITKNIAPRSNPKELVSVPPPADKAGQDNEIKAVLPNGIIIKSIKFEPKKDREKVFIASNTFFVPEILTLEGDKPRIVIDIKPVSSWSGRHRTPVKGNLIRQIRTHLHPGTKKLRIVLDLNPSENYFINQVYYEKKNIYCIEVR